MPAAGDDRRARGVLSAARRAAAVTRPALPARARRQRDRRRRLRRQRVGHAPAASPTCSPTARCPPARPASSPSEVADALDAAHQQGLAPPLPAARARAAHRHGQIKVAGLGVDAAVAGCRCPTRSDAAATRHRGAAAVLYAALTARWPGAEATALPAAPHDGDRVCSPRQVRAGVPDDLDALVCRALGTAGRGHGGDPVRTPRRARAGARDAPQATSRIPVVQQPVERRRRHAVPAADLPRAVRRPRPPRVGRWPPRSPGWPSCWSSLVGLGLAGWQLVTAVGDRGGDDRKPRGRDVPRRHAVRGEPPVRVTERHHARPAARGRRRGERRPGGAGLRRGRGRRCGTPTSTTSSSARAGSSGASGWCSTSGATQRGGRGDGGPRGAGTDLQVRPATTGATALADYEVWPRRATPRAAPSWRRRARDGPLRAALAHQPARGRRRLPRPSRRGHRPQLAGCHVLGWTGDRPGAVGCVAERRRLQMGGGRSTPTSPTRSCSTRTPPVTPTRSASSCAGTATGSGPWRCARSATARRQPTPCRTPVSALRRGPARAAQRGVPRRGRRHDLAAPHRRQRLPRPGAPPRRAAAGPAARHDVPAARPDPLAAREHGPGRGRRPGHPARRAARRARPRRHVRLARRRRRRRCSTARPAP